MKHKSKFKAGASIKKLLLGLPVAHQIIILQTAIMDLEFDQEQLVKEWLEKAAIDAPLESRQ